MPQDTESPAGFKPLAPTGFRRRVEVPPGFKAVEPEERGLFRRVSQRFMGTDVDDPLPLERAGATMVGAIAGGLAGARTPVAPGPAGVFVNPVTGAVAGSLIGTITGAVAPEATMEFGEAVGLLPKGYREQHGLSPEDLRTLVEGEALLDLAFGGGVLGLRAIGRGASQVFAGVGREGRELAEAAAKQDIMLLPIQVGKSRIARGYVSVFGRIPWMGGGQIRKKGQAAEDALRAAFERTPERFAPLAAWSDISETIFTDASNLVKATNKRFKKLYGDLWARADELDVRAVPRETLTKADEILAKLSAQTPTAITGKPTAPGAALQKVQDFITDEVLVLREAIEEGGTIKSQSLRQMDGLASKIDQEIASLEPGQKRFAMSLLIQLRQAVQSDAITNIRGAQGDEIARAMRELDKDFSKTISQLFETATAKKFGSVRKRGLRAIEADETTRIPVDQLARMVVKLDSPQAIDELSRLVTPETFNQVVSRIFGDAAEAATLKVSDNFTTGFNADAWARNLGLKNATSNKRKAIDIMLKRSGSPLTVKDLDDLVRISEAISSVEIPNMATFLARRAGISGLRGAINGITPGIAVASTAGTATWLGGGFLGFATMVGGGQLVSRILSKPESARSLLKVLDKEATNLVRKQAWADGIRTGLFAMLEDGLIDAPTLSEINEFADEALAALDQQFKDLIE